MGSRKIHKTKWTPGPAREFDNHGPKLKSGNIRKRQIGYESEVKNEHDFKRKKNEWVS